MKAKGNVFKNKRVLMEYIFRAKSEKQRTKTLEEQSAAYRARNKAARERRAARIVEKHRLAVTGDDVPKELQAVAAAVKKAPGRPVIAEPAAPPKPTGPPKTAAEKRLERKVERTKQKKVVAAAKKEAKKPKPAEPKPAAEKPAEKPAEPKPAAEKQKAPAQAKKKKQTGGAQKQQQPPAKKQQ